MDESRLIALGTVKFLYGRFRAELDDTSQEMLLVSPIFRNVKRLLNYLAE